MYLIIINGTITGINYKYAILVQELLSKNKIGSNIYSCLNQDLIDIDNYEKIIFIVPEWNGSYPGQVKIFIDNQGHPNKFQDKKTSIIGISGGWTGNQIGVSHLRDVLEYIGSNVSRLKVYIPSDKLNITNSEYITRLEEFVNNFIEF